MSANPFDYVSQKPQPATPTSKKLVDILQYFVLLLSVMVVVYLFFMIPTQVDGVSMMPNFQNDEVLLTNRLIQLVGGEGQLAANYDYQRGDVVVFTRNNQPDLIKRIVGLPGERVAVKDNHVFINGQKLMEDYIDPIVKPTSPGTFLAAGQEKIVPAGSYLALGDNRTNSLDSRSAEVGFVKRSQLRGAPFLRLLPLTNFGSIPRGNYRLEAQ